jgi:UDP-N-acetylmuramoyl-tripeptide--D-alanyl-D-alanine ligase
MTEAPLWTGDEVLRATGGSGPAGWQAASVSIDTRTLRPGALFVAIAGPRFDGHDFVAEALTRGAAAALVSRPPAEAGVAEDAPLVRVADTLAALGALGAAARARTSARVVAVTGSVGKTSVKEGLRAVLALQGETVASEGSLNNHWGVPLSLARLPKRAAYGVLEIGMNHAGEIAPLSRLARPQVAVITTIAPAHLGNFASIEAICDAKAEIFAGLEGTGIAVLNRDNPFFARLRAAALAKGGVRVIGFGRTDGAEVRLIAAELDADGARVRADVLGTAVEYRLNLAGSHAVDNSLCVLAAVAAAGADVAAAAAGLAEVRAVRGRGERFAVRLAGSRFALIDDSYNANPASMRAALEVLGRIAPGRGGRRLAVLGDMLELGAASAALHRELAVPLRDYGIDRVFTAGPAMAELFAALPATMRGAHAADAQSLVPAVTAAVRAGDVVVVKGSAGSRMARVVEALRALDAGNGEATAEDGGDPGTASRPARTGGKA